MFIRYWVMVVPFLMFATDVFARAGGGRNAKCGWLCVILYPFLIVAGIYVNYKINKKRKQVSRALQEMATREPQWTEGHLIEDAKQCFQILQAAWSSQDLMTMRSRMHPALFSVWESQINDQIQRGEKNIISGVSINKVRIVDVRNYRDNERDEFTICFDAKALDEIILNGVVKSSDNSAFREFWTFEWEKGQWLLKEVTQSEGWRRFVYSPIIYELKN